ncbi:MAG: hypothetical protein ACRC33_18290, partial [Gemmataceae bacterium]
GNDIFNVASGVSVTAGGDHVDGEGGSDLVVFAGSSAVHVFAVSGDGYSLGVGSATNTFAGINAVRADAATGDTLFGRDVASTWTLTASAATTTYAGGGTALSFDGFNVVQGGTAADSFALTAAYADSSAINGGAGADSFTVSIDFPTTTLATLNGQAGSDTLTYTANVTTRIIGPTFGGGSTGTDGGLTGGFTGMENFSTQQFLPLDTDNVIQMTSQPNPGPGGGVVRFVRYFSVSNLVESYANRIDPLDVPGGAGNDRFELIFNAPFKVFGAGGNDALDFRPFTTGQDITLVSSSDPNALPLPAYIPALGSAYFGTSAQGTRFRDLSRLIGNDGMVNSLTGLAVPSSWEVETATGSYTGGRSSSLEFQSFYTITGKGTNNKLAVTDATENLWDVESTGEFRGSLTLQGAPDSYEFTTMQNLVGGANKDTFMIDKIDVVVGANGTQQLLLDSVAGYDPLLGNIDPTRADDQVLYTANVDTVEQLLVELEDARASGIRQFSGIDQFIAQADKARVVVLAHRAGDPRLTVKATPTSVTIPKRDPVTGEVTTETINFFTQNPQGVTDEGDGWDFRTDPDFKTEFQMFKAPGPQYHNIFFSTPKIVAGTGGQPAASDLADTFDYSSYFGPGDAANAALAGVTVNLQDGTASGIGAGFTFAYKPLLAKDAPKYPGLGLGVVVGSSRRDAIRGRNQPNRWKSDPAVEEFGGPDAGDLGWNPAGERTAAGAPILPANLAGLLVQFRSVETLLGGDLDDTFTLRSGTSFSGLIDGGAGTNVLDVVGSAGADLIGLRPGAINLNGQTTAIARLSVARLTGGEGDDQLSVAYAGLSTPYASIQLIGGGGFDSLTVESVVGSAVRGRAYGTKFALGRGNLLTKFPSRFDPRPRFANVLLYTPYQILFDSTEKLEVHGGRLNDQFDATAAVLKGNFLPRGLDGRVLKAVDETTRQLTSTDWRATSSLAQVKYVSGGGDDLVRLVASTTTQFIVVGSGKDTPASLGTGVYLLGVPNVLYARPVLVANQGYDVLYQFLNRQSIQLLGVSRGMGGRVDVRPVAIRSAIPLLF